MEKLLTVIVQTSPIPSHPGTALLDALFKSFSRVDGLLESRVIIVCDGCEEQAKGSGEAENLKHGKASPATGARYRDHLKILKKKLDSLQPPFSPKAAGSIELLELTGRHGSARAIDRAFFSQVKTPFVMIAQHDNFFVRDIDLKSVVAAMEKHPWARAIHFPAISTLNYKEKTQKRYGIDIQQRFMTTENGDPFCLLPLVFWYGRTHVARSDYYRDFVLSPDRRASLKVKDHLEELLGNTQLQDIIKNSMATHSLYGNYTIVIKDETGVEVEALYHLSGRRALAQGKEKESTGAANSRHGTETRNGDGYKETIIGTRSWTTSRSCHAVVPGLYIPQQQDATKPKGRFKQKCFNCGEKGHSFKFCPKREKLVVKTVYI